MTLGIHSQEDQKNMKFVVTIYEICLKENFTNLQIDTSY